jgi:uroporphyrinogen-III synthase
MVSGKSPQKWRALLTRPREETDALVEALAARGVDAQIDPMIEIHFRDAAPDLAGVQAVLCTSANGVRALARVNPERRLPLFAVGDSTAARARALGFERVESAFGNSTDLVRLAADRLQPRRGRLVHACGSDVAGDLAGRLRRRGFTVESFVLYEARSVAALSAAATAALAASAIDLALFFSPRTAAIFTRLAAAAGIARACETIAALSISAAADTALGATRWREQRIAERPDQPALLAALDELIAERRGC